MLSTVAEEPTHIDKCPGWTYGRYGSDSIYSKNAACAILSRRLDNAYAFDLFHFLRATPPNRIGACHPRFYGSSGPVRNYPHTRYPRCLNSQSLSSAELVVAHNVQPHVQIAPALSPRPTPNTIMSNSSPLLNLPLELLLPILSLSLASHPTPSHVLRVSSQIHTLSSPILYKNLCFRSPDVMVKFIENGKPSRRPRSVVVDLAGGAVGGGAFRALRGVFEKCLAVVDEDVDADMGEDTSGGWRREGEEGGNGHGHGEWRLPLELLKLRLHSTSNSNTDDISLSALGLVK